MPARKKKNGNGNGNGANRAMKRKPPINLDHLKTIEPLTDNQTVAFDAYGEGKHLVLHGAAGTGKTFISLYVRSFHSLREGLHGQVFSTNQRDWIPTRRSRRQV